MEEWRDIEGYEGLYQVSSEGRIMSLCFNHTENNPKTLKLLNVRGYRVINLYKDKKLKQLKVHRLVAEAFIPNPNNLPQVNHKDENKTNNCVSNLEWCDTKYNINYGTAIERSAKTRTKHTAEENKQLERERNGKYRELHRDELREKGKKWRASNNEYLKRISKERYASLTEEEKIERNAKAREYYALKKEERNAKARERYKLKKINKI